MLDWVGNREGKSCRVSYSREDLLPFQTHCIAQNGDAVMYDLFAGHREFAITACCTSGSLSHGEAVLLTCFTSEVYNNGSSYTVSFSLNPMNRLMGRDSRRIDSTCSLRINLGAGLPAIRLALSSQISLFRWGSRISAVVMIMSTSLLC